MEESEDRVEIDQKIVRQLEEWQREEGYLPEYLELYRDLLLITLESKGSIPSPLPITEAEVKDALRNGIPLVKWDAIPIDWPAFQELFQRVFALVIEHADPAPHKSKETDFSIPPLQDMAKAWYEGASLSSWAAKLRTSEDLLATVIHSAIKPFLNARTGALAKLIEQGQWRRGYCPVCGGKPDFAFLDKERGARWLVCSRCDAVWLFQRMECPHCGNTDQKKLAFLTDDKELYRLYTCQHCHRYIKAIDLRQAKSEVLIPLERVLTFDMDRQGQEKGYTQ